jgi:hypothetical protein
MTTLAELRLANLREQKKSAAEPVPAVPEPTPAAVPEVIASAPLPAEREDDLVLSQYLSDAAPVMVVEPLADADAEKSAALIARVHSLLAHKTLHPNGAKATVDMSPALFHRSKRYCLDHGNVTLRQLFLDLMTAFLDEEGY